MAGKIYEQLSLSLVTLTALTSLNEAYNGQGRTRANIWHNLMCHQHGPGSSSLKNLFICMFAFYNIHFTRSNRLPFNANSTSIVTEAGMVATTKIEFFCRWARNEDRYLNGCRNAMPYHCITNYLTGFTQSPSILLLHDLLSIIILTTVTHPTHRKV